MGEIRFKYLSLPRREIHPAFPEWGNRVAMPLIPVTLRQMNWTEGPLYMMLDSGADHCIVNARHGIALGLDIKSGVSSTTCGIGGTQQTVWFHTIEIEVEGRRLECKCAFGDLAVPFPGLLGREGFFSRFNVSFDQRNESITLKYRDADFPRPLLP